MVTLLNESVLLTTIKIPLDLFNPKRKAEDMETKMYEAFLIQSDGKKFQAVKPAIYMTISHMMDLIEESQPFKKMFLVYHESLGDLIPPRIHDKYGVVHPEMFDINPKVFGVLCYKNNKGRIRFK